jgi:DNA-binding transcriptional LysR family regulator
MTTAIATTDVDRLGKLVRVALISDEDGEILGAVAALKRALAATGVDAHWLAAAFERGAAPPAHGDDHDDDGDDRSATWFCWHRRHRLSPKEKAFIENIVTWSGPLSARQRRRLGDIVDKLEEGAA